MSRLQKEIGNGILVQSVVETAEKDNRMEFNEWMAFRVQSIHYANQERMYLAFQKLENNGINKPSAS